MRCRNEDCLYNDGEGYCKLCQVSIDRDGKCDDCIEIPSKPTAQGCEDDS